MSRKALVVSLTLLVSAFACQAGAWTLPGIDGHAPSVWVGERNWTQESGNPMPDQGASWGLYYQADETGAFKPMVYGLAYNFNFVWRSAEGTKLAEGHGEDPACQYIETTLSCADGTTFPGDGPSSLVTFKPNGAGKFKLEIDGTVAVKSPTAGNAKLRVVVLDSALKTIKEVKSLELKSKDNASIGETIELKAGECIGVAIQSVNPGMSGCGRCSIAFKKLKVSGI